MKAALGQRNNWSESRKSEWRKLIDYFRNTVKCKLFIPWGSSALFPIVSVFKLKSKIPTNKVGQYNDQEKASDLTVMNRIESAYYCFRLRAVSWVYTIVVAPATGSHCHLFLWHSDFRWKRPVLGPGRISKWSWLTPFSYGFKTVFGVSEKTEMSLAIKQNKG